MTFRREAEVLAGLEGVRRRAAAAAALAGLFSVRGLLSIEASDFWIVAGLFAGPAVVGAWTEPVLASLGAALVSVRGHLLYWFVFALACLAGVGGVLAGASPAETEPPLRFFVGSLLVVGYGLAGPQALRLHGVLSLLVLFHGLARGGPERFLWWGGYAVAMAVLLSAQRLHREVRRYRFEESGAVGRAVLLGGVSAAVYLALLLAAMAVGPETEGVGTLARTDPDWIPAAYPEASPVWFVVSLLGVVVLSVLLVRFHLYLGGRQPAAAEEATIVGTVERRGPLPAPALGVPRFRSDRERVAHLYLSWCRGLSLAGCRRSEWMTPDEYAGKVVSRLPGSAAAARRVTDLFQRACYSRDPVGPEDVRAMRELVEREWMEA